MLTDEQIIAIERNPGWLCGVVDWSLFRGLIAQAREANRFRRDAEAMDVLRKNQRSRNCDAPRVMVPTYDGLGYTVSGDPADALLAWKAKYGGREVSDETA